MTIAAAATLQRLSDTMWTGTVRVLENPRTMRIALVVFTLFAALFAVIVHMPVVNGSGSVPYAGTIAPDEHRHIANILFYAHRSVWRGPILHHVPARDLSMGEIIRFPSYFYYYALGFPAKVLIDLHASYALMVIALRMVSVLMGVLGLVAVHRLLRTVGFSSSIATLATLVLAFTGRYMWQSAAVSYDAPSTTLYFVCLLFCARLIRDPGYGDLVIAVVSGLGAVVTKYTFVPFVVVALALALALVLQRDGLRPFVRPFGRAIALLRRRVVWSIGWGALLVLVLVVAGERLGGNLLVYGQFNPSCTKLHSHVQCLVFDIYRRNFFAARAHDLGTVHGATTQFDALQFVGGWLSTYFDTLFFYRGRTSGWTVEPWVEGAGLVLFVAACIATLLTMRSLVRTRALAWAFAVTATYVVAMFVFNVQTWLRLDEAYAFAGRYMLPVLPLIYAFAIVSGIATWRTVPAFWQRVIVGPGLLLGAFVLVTYWAPVAFFAYARDPSWYTDVALRILPHFLTGMTG